MSYPEIEPVEFLAADSNSVRLRPKAQTDLQQVCNIVYAETHGTGLVMDVFSSPNHNNGLAIIDIASREWHAGRTRINEHIALGIMDVLCGHGFTVFALSPGSVTCFTGPRMLQHIHAGIRYIKTHAEDFQIDPERLGLMGFSAGGHLAALAALAPQSPTRRPQRPDTAVAAAGLFFAPSDLAALGPERFAPTAPNCFPERLLFQGGLGQHSGDEVQARLDELSPARHVGENPPPFLLIHGTADRIVPYTQSVCFAEALRDAGGEVELLTKPDGAHPWPDLRPEMRHLADWFQERLTVREQDDQQTRRIG